DVFYGGTVGAPIPNTRFIDGDGLPLAAPPALGLVEPGDDITALAGCKLPPIGSSASTWITLGPGSPTLTAIGATPADVLAVGYGYLYAPSVWIPAAYLGLGPGDVIDALAYDFAFSGGYGRVMFSLAPGSPTLLAIGAGPEDVLIANPNAPAPPTVLV